MVLTAIELRKSPATKKPRSRGVSDPVPMDYRVSDP